MLEADFRITHHWCSSPSRPPPRRACSPRPKPHIHPPPRLIIREMPLVSSPCRILGEQIVPGATVNFSPRRVSNSSVPASVITYWRTGAGATPAATLPGSPRSSPGTWATTATGAPPPRFGELIEPLEMGLTVLSRVEPYQRKRHEMLLASKIAPRRMNQTFRRLSTSAVSARTRRHKAASSSSDCP